MKLDLESIGNLEQIFVKKDCSIQLRELVDLLDRLKVNFQVSTPGVEEAF